jgi:hypothetical protein
MYEMIQSLEKGQTIKFNYGKQGFTLGVHGIDGIVKYMNVSKDSKFATQSNMAMNIDQVTEELIWLFDYNMMGVRNEGKMYISHITNIQLITPDTVKDVASTFTTDMDTIIKDGIFGE